MIKLASDMKKSKYTHYKIFGEIDRHAYISPIGNNGKTAEFQYNFFVV